MNFCKELLRQCVRVLAGTNVNGESKMNMMPKTVFFIVSVGIVLILNSCSKEENIFIPHANTMDTIMHDGIVRTFLLHVPPDYSSSQPVPLVVGMHGYTSSAINFEAGSRLSEKADSEGFIIAYPNGLAYPWNASNPQAWNVGAIYEEWTRGTDDVGFIDEMIKMIQRYYSIDASRIYVTGHSNGSRMTYRLGHELSCTIAAIAPHSGQMVYEPETFASCEVPVLHLHAINDPTVLYSGATTGELLYQPADSILSYWARMYSCSSTPDITVVNNDYQIKKWGCPGNRPDIELILTNRGEHNWFTVENSGISANDVIWDFFLAHPKN
jgi:polyhydroxybutyrate depolymerase